MATSSTNPLPAPTLTPVTREEFSAQSEQLKEILSLLAGRKPAPESSVSFGVLDFFKKAAEASLVLAVFLYIAGWSYLFAYYRTFGVDLRQLGIPTQEAMIFAGAALFGDPLIIAMLACIGVLVAILVLLEKRFPSRISALLFFFALFTLYGAASWQASQVGHTSALLHASELDGTLPNVSILIDLKKLPEANDLYPGITDGEYKLLLQNTDGVWIFKPVLSGRKYPSWVTMIPADSIRALSLERYLY